MKVNKSFFKKTGTGFYDKETKNGEENIFIYDEISPFGVIAERVVSDIESAIKGGSRVRLRINSPGGLISDGIAIFNSVKRHRDKITTQVDGIAASSASFIFLAGGERVMSEATRIFVHEPWAGMVGTADDFRNEAKALDGFNDDLVSVIAPRTKKTEQEIRAMLKQDTWINGKDAMEFGFTDTVETYESAKNTFDLSVFNNVPDDLLSDTSETLDERTLEKILREAGLSRNKAKALLADGVKALGLRDNSNAECIKSIIDTIKK